MKILCLNCGSSSVKYSLFDWDKKIALAAGVVERVGLTGSFVAHEVPDKEKVTVKQDCPSHKEAIKLVIDTLTSPLHGVIKDLKGISAVGHRVVHGGEKFVKSVLIDDNVLSVFRELSALAPLHNPPNILGIEAARELMPAIRHIAIMDTAWHQTMPASSYLYALPYSWYEKYGIRRYGFHGTSFLYVAKRAAVLLGRDPFSVNLVICHIGNGASVNVVKNGLSYDTSMGFTPLEGLVMGTRAGDHDPAIGLFVMEKEGLKAREMDSILNKKSGILGITGKFTDRRDVETAAAGGDARAALAMEIEAYRIKKYIGAYSAAVGGIDAVVFTAGVGEKGAITRAQALGGLETLGINLDENKNALSTTRNAETIISADNSRVKIFVIPTDEERVFVEDVAGLLKGDYDVHAKFHYSFQDIGYRNAMRDKAFEKECGKKPGLEKIAARPVGKLVR
ncbi:MAG: propionate kinase [Elusimicrobia bacterium GWF2_52_66]|nr:MAG: propionate kinase [Elusimicrobia bacterium GWA2_51_34]OGR87330.1 MAG: propionate kinase [Elusimicrobia bacterium GWF2_52_66]HAF94915.1 propionate kinase [Elusimicrobiota bacterium]HCE97511.1 propionate kinase [Elusimicrobiota bacterium]